MTAAALEMRGIAKRFGPVRAVVDGHLTVRRGEAIALIGANGAGKSTMMNVLGGVFPPDEGQILRDGKAVQFDSPVEAAAAGVQFVHQELSVFRWMTVAENIFIDGFPTRSGLIDRASINERATELLSLLGSNLDPSQTMDGLSTGDAQMVEIARAMRGDPAILILDEPTSSLTKREKAKLDEVILLLKEQGVAIIYITHFISEIFSVCDRAFVMRNGETVADSATDAVDSGELVRLMLGEVAAAGRIVGPLGDDAPVYLSVEDLRLEGKVEHASFSLRRGEILGVWGLLGSGRTELVRTLLGLDGHPEGRIRVMTDGGLAPTTPDRLAKRTAFVSEDRRREGLLLPMSVARNTALPNLKQTSTRIGWMLKGLVDALAKRVIDGLSIKVSGPGQIVGTLSGGNQQKVVFGKWLETKPDLLILDEPTRGLDIAAKGDILRLSAKLAGSGVAILLISSELEELMNVCHRYVIVSERRIVSELSGSTNEATLVAALSPTGAGAAA
ncbi:MAG: sugar ABC transporter ATP-binding protein [Hyphomicrobiales bacterium]|nr:sugar ABC transporter ATP-binding protein [Hyphomicrobiales bacterium]